MITSLDKMVQKVLSSGKKYRVAVAWAQDQNSISALGKAVQDGFIEALMIGDGQAIKRESVSCKVDPGLFTIIESANETEASKKSVEMTRNGEADIAMKGLVGTDKFLKAVMDKEKGLMLPNATLSYVCAIQLPAYHKLLFITDPAVIPFPDLDQKIAMAEYAIKTACRFGIEKPRVALVGASEKMSKHFDNSVHYAIMCKMSERGQISNCIMDGPLDIFLACDPNSVEIKGVSTPVNGDADILLFPTIESCNPFYKGLMLFAGGELGGMIMGTTKPVVVMSRSESEKSKYYCIAFACMMA
ncbi:MAG: phosphate acyltransferase [Bacteroidales bacterium]